jgi:hypothetical protein
MEILFLGCGFGFFALDIFSIIDATIVIPNVNGAISNAKSAPYPICGIKLLEKNNIMRHIVIIPKIFDVIIFIY